MTVLMLPYELEDPAGNRVPFLPAPDGNILSPAAWDMLQVPEKGTVFDPVPFDVLIDGMDEGYWDREGDWIAPPGLFRIRRRTLYSRHLLLCSGDVVARVWRFHCVFHPGPAAGHYDCRAPWGAAADVWRLRKHLERAMRAYERGRGREPDAWVVPNSVRDLNALRIGPDDWRLPFRLHECSDGRLLIRCLPPA